MHFSLKSLISLKWGILYLIKTAELLNTEHRLAVDFFQTKLHKLHIENWSAMVFIVHSRTERIQAQITVSYC